MTEANNKKTFWLSFFSLGLFFLFIPTLFGSAAFSETINYQGKLMDDAGDLVADGSYNMRFRLCADDACASVLYDESWVDSDKVAVTNGLFSVLIGSVSSTLGSVDFNQDVYLEVSVGGTDVPVWEALSPRKRLGAVPNAFNTQKFDGLATTSFLRADIANATGTINNLNSQHINVSGDNSWLKLKSEPLSLAYATYTPDLLDIELGIYNTEAITISSQINLNGRSITSLPVDGAIILKATTSDTVFNINNSDLNQLFFGIGTEEPTAITGLYFQSVTSSDGGAGLFWNNDDFSLAYRASYVDAGIHNPAVSFKATNIDTSFDNYGEGIVTYDRYSFNNIVAGFSIHLTEAERNLVAGHMTEVTGHNNIVGGAGGIGVYSSVVGDNNLVMLSGDAAINSTTSPEALGDGRSRNNIVVSGEGTNVVGSNNAVFGSGYNILYNNHNNLVNGYENFINRGSLNVSLGFNNRITDGYKNFVFGGGHRLNSATNTVLFGNNITVEGEDLFVVNGSDQSLAISGDNIFTVMGMNVGFGTTTPQTALHVVGTSTLGVTSMSYDSWIGSGLGTNSIQFSDYTIPSGYGSGSNINLITSSNDVPLLGVANGLGVYGLSGSDATIILGNDSYAYTAIISQNSADNELTVAQLDSGLNPYPFSQMKLTADKILLDGNTNSDIVLDFDGRGSITVATTTGYMNFTSATGYNFTGSVTTTQLYANQLFGSQLSVGILSGVLQATNGLVSVTTSPTFSGLNLLSYNGVLQATDGVVSANDSILVDDVKLSNLYFTTSSITSVPLINVTNTTDLHFSGASNYDWLDSGGRSFFNINSSSSQLTVTGDPSVIASNLSLPISMRNIHIVDGYLYAALYGSNSVDSFRIIDIADPYNPRIVGGENINDLPHAPAKRVYVNGNYAYLTYDTATTTDTFRILDISDKSNPRVIGGANLDTQMYGSSGEPLYVSGNYVYIIGVNIYNQYKNDLIVIDVSNPYNPIIISRLTDLPMGVWDIKSSGDYVYGCFHDTSTPLAIINVKNKKSPFLVSTSSVGNVGEDCWSIDFSGSRLYLGLGGFYGDASNTDVFRIVDISDPYNPVVKGGSGLDFGSIPDGSLGGFNFLKIFGQYLYALSWGGYFHKIDISSSTNPVGEMSYDIDDVDSGGAINPLTFDMVGNNVFVGYAPIPSTGESTRYFRVFSLPGINSVGGYFSSLLSGQLRVSNDAIFDHRVNVSDSLLVGSGGIFSDGGLSVISTTSVSYFGGQLTIGTTTATSTTSSLVVGGAILSTDLLGGPTTLSTDANGNIIRTPSDMRLKENVELINGALSGVLALNPVYYNWKDKSRFGEQREIGLLAQEVQGIFPEVISAGSEYLSVNYQALVPVLVSAIKDQQEQINAITEGKELLAVSDTPYATDNLSINKLTVRKAASFYGTIIVVGEAGFATKVTFSDHVYFNEDSAGTAKIIANATSTEIKFAKPYETAPIITITPKKKMSGTSWWVENESVDGFTIAIDPASEQEWEFNWQAVAISGVGISAVPEDVSPVEPEVVPEEPVPDTDSGLENSTGTALQLIIDNSAGLPESAPEEPNLSLEDTSGMVPEGPALPAEEPQEQSSQNESSESE
mgnify:CR=1 FL=1